MFQFYRKDSIKGAKHGMEINGVEFKKQPVTVIFRNELKHFENNSWFICLEADELDSVVQNNPPSFLKMYEYARKMKDAIEIDDNVIVTFKQKRVLSKEEFKSLADEIIAHEEAYQTVSRSNGSEMIEILEDYDAADL